MMVEQVTYLISGTAHLPYLVPSIASLRASGYVGCVQVHSWPESIELVKAIEKDDRLGITAFEREPKLRKKDGIGSNSQFLDKIDLTRSLDCDVSIYLDADTTVHGDISQLFYRAKAYGFCFTQFNKWFTTDKRISKRLRELKGIENIPDELVDLVLADKYPSVNGGVWASLIGESILDSWYNMTRACGKLFIADEKILHLLQLNMNPEAVLLGGQFNCSHKFKSKHLAASDVVIWHYHGDSNVKMTEKGRKKSEAAYKFWMPLYFECLKANLGGIANWRHMVGNRYLGGAEANWQEQKNCSKCQQSFQPTSKFNFICPSCTLKNQKIRTMPISSTGGTHRKTIT